MDSSITFDYSELAGFMTGLTDGEMEQAFKDAVQVVLNSTKVGYMEEVSPDGKKWQSNVEWYSTMKGNSATLTGPLSTAIKGGNYADLFSFANTNKKRMKNSLIWNVDVQKKEAKIEYDSDAEERAGITQAGGEAKLILSATGSGFFGGGDLEIDITIPARPHLRLSKTYSRLGGKSDPELSQEIFADMYGKSVNKTVSDFKGII